MFVEQGGRHPEVLTLAQYWLHPFFQRFDQVVWSWSKKEINDREMLLWGSGNDFSRPMITVRKVKYFSDTAISDILLAQVNPEIAFSRLANNKILPKVSEWQNEEQENDGLCLRIINFCQSEGLTKYGIALVTLSVYRSRHGWIPAGNAVV